MTLAFFVLKDKFKVLGPCSGLEGCVFGHGIGL